MNETVLSTEEANFKINTPVNHITGYAALGCNFAASVSTQGMTYPLNKLVFRQKLSGQTAREAYQLLVKEGTKNLYRGFTAPILQRSASMSLSFGSYLDIEDVVRMQTGLSLNSSAVAASIIAGTLEASFTPFTRVQNAMMDPKFNAKFSSPSHFINHVLKHHSLAEFYRGLSVTAYRNSLRVGLFYNFREPIKKKISKGESSGVSNVIYNFLTGSVIGAFSSTLIYPINVAKVRMQSNLGTEFHSFTSTMKLICRERNYSIRKIYRGVQMNVLRSMLGWGIFNVLSSYFIDAYLKLKHK